MVSPPGMAPIIKILHDGHPGVSQMKSLARSAVWWPGLDAELKAKVKSYEACQVNSRSPPKSLLRPWSGLQNPGLTSMMIFMALFWAKSFLSW